MKESNVAPFEARSSILAPKSPWGGVRAGRAPAEEKRSRELAASKAIREKSMKTIANAGEVEY